MTRYDVPAGGRDAAIRVYDVGGRLVRTVVDCAQTRGHREANWYGRDGPGTAVASGFYFCQLTAGDKVIARKTLHLN